MPGQTPFLISNSILKGLKRIIDVDERVLQSQGHEAKIQLHPCGKNLLGVNVAELLTKSPPTTPEHGPETDTITQVENVKVEDPKKCQVMNTTGQEVLRHVLCHAKNPNHHILVNEQIPEETEYQTRVMKRGFQVRIFNKIGETISVIKIVQPIRTF